MTRGPEPRGFSFWGSMDKQTIIKLERQAQDAMKIVADLFGEPKSPLEIATILVVLAPLLANEDLKRYLSNAHYLVSLLAVKHGETMAWEDGRAFMEPVDEKDRKKLVEQFVVAMNYAKERFKEPGLFDEEVIALANQLGVPLDLRPSTQEGIPDRDSDI